MDLNSIRKDIHDGEIEKAIRAINSFIKTPRDEDLSDKLHSIRSAYEGHSMLGGYFLKKDKIEEEIQKIKKQLLQLVEELEELKKMEGLEKLENKSSKNIPEKSTKKNYSKVVVFFISFLLLGVSFLYYFYIIDPKVSEDKTQVIQAPLVYSEVQDVTNHSSRTKEEGHFFYICGR